MEKSLLSTDTGFSPRAKQKKRWSTLTAAVLVSMSVFFIVFHHAYLLELSRHRPRSSLSPSSLHPSTHPSDRDIDWSFLSHERQCPGLKPIGLQEFEKRRDRLGELLLSERGGGWSAYVTETSANTLYFLNLTQSDWYLSERPWLAVITPTSSSSGGEGPKHHLTILTPSFELSRSQRLPFALSKQGYDRVSWLTWKEHEDPYRVLVRHLKELYKREEGSGGGVEWTRIEIEENVRQFIAQGIEQAVVEEFEENDGDLGRPKVGLARIEVRELRMKKTRPELEIQRCVAKITLEALRAVRTRLRIGMTEKQGEALIINALKAGGLTNIGAIVLFGENAALPHASAGSKILEKGEFALFDVDGALFGYMSDFTRTMLPDDPRNDNFKSTCTFPNERSRKIYETVQRAQRAALAKLVTTAIVGDGGETRSVVYASEVDQAARRVIEEAGWGEHFTHRLGHGVGLEVHEHPYLNSGNSHQILQPGETFSNEPGIYIEGEGGIGVRLEDMVLKTEKGWELISDSQLASSPCDF